MCKAVLSICLHAMLWIKSDSCRGHFSASVVGYVKLVFYTYGYLPFLAATTYDPVLKAFYNRFRLVPIVYRQIEHFHFKVQTFSKILGKDDVTVNLVFCILVLGFSFMCFYVLMYLDVIT